MYFTDGVRCKKTYNGVTTKYLLDGNKILGEIQSGLDYEHWTITNGKRHVKYFYDCEGITGAMIGQGTFEYIKDDLGNVVMLLDQDDGKVACFYRYDAFGNCTVFDRNGKIDTDIHSIGNTNPIRWKSFYYDVETKFYYANGSYYDPSTGTYLDAAPVSTVIDNALTTNCLDRNTPVCDNILTLAGNPFNVVPATELSPDPTYNGKANWPWWLIAEYKIQQAIYDVVKWYRKLHWAIKFVVGTLLLLGAIFLTALTAGSAAEMELMAAQFILGIGLGIGSYLFGAVLSGEFSWKGLANAALDAFLATSAMLFISTGINALKGFFRKLKIKIKLISRAKKYRRILIKKYAGDTSKHLQFATVTYDAKLGTYTEAFNSEIDMTLDMYNPTLRSLMPKTSCSEMQAVNQALNAGSNMEDLYIYTIKIQNGKAGYACPVCTRVLNGRVAGVFSGFYSGPRG